MITESVKLPSLLCKTLKKPHNSGSTKFCTLSTQPQCSQHSKGNTQPFPVNLHLHFTCCHLHRHSSHSSRRITSLLPTSSVEARSKNLWYITAGLSLQVWQQKPSSMQKPFAVPLTKMGQKCRISCRRRLAPLQSKPVEKLNFFFHLHTLATKKNRCFQQSERSTNVIDCSEGPHPRISWTWSCHQDT